MHIALRLAHQPTRLKEMQMSKKLNLRRIKSRHPTPRLEVSSSNSFYTKVKALEGNPFVRLLDIAAILAFPYQLWETSKINQATLVEIEAGRAEREHEAIARSWSLLAMARPGNSGKVGAIEFLVSQGISLHGIDVSCASMGGMTETILNGEPVRQCVRATVLTGLNLGTADESRRALLNGANLSGANLSEANLHNVVLAGADLSNAYLYKTNMQSAGLHSTNFSGATLVGTILNDAHLVGANFTGSHLVGVDLTSARMTGANFTNARMESNSILEPYPDGPSFLDANLSNTQFQVYDEEIPSRNFQRVWAWADTPPLNLPANIRIQLCKFDPETNERDERPTNCVRPQETP